MIVDTDDILARVGFWDLYDDSPGRTDRDTAQQ